MCEIHLRVCRRTDFRHDIGKLEQLRLGRHDAYIRRRIGRVRKARFQPRSALDQAVVSKLLKLKRAVGRHRHPRFSLEALLRRPYSHTLSLSWIVLCWESVWPMKCGFATNYAPRRRAEAKMAGKIAFAQRRSTKASLRGTAVSGSLALTPDRGVRSFTNRHKDDGIFCRTGRSVAISGP